MVEGKLQKRIKKLMYEDNSIDDGYDVLFNVDEMRKDFEEFIPKHPFIKEVYQKLAESKDEEIPCIVKVIVLLMKWLGEGEVERVG